MTRRTRLRRTSTDVAITAVPAQATSPEPPDARWAEPTGPGSALRELAADEGRPVADLLREVAEFRLALDVDLTIAAAAAEAHAPEVAADVMSGDVDDLRALEDRMIRGLVAAAALEAAAEPIEAPAPAPRTRALRRRPRGSAMRRGMALHTGPVLAAAVAIGLAGGFALPHLDGGSRQTTRATADAQFASLSKAVGAFDDSDALVAAQALHVSVGQLIDNAADSPADARDAARLLLAEGVVLKGVQGPDGDVLRSQMTALVQRLQATAGPILLLVDTPDSTPDSPSTVSAVAASPSTRTIAPIVVSGARTTTGVPAPSTRAPLTRVLPLPAVSVRVPLLIPTRRPSPVDLPRPSTDASLPVPAATLTPLPVPQAPSPAASTSPPAEPTAAPPVSPSVAPGSPQQSSPAPTASATDSPTAEPSSASVLPLPGNSPSASDNGGLGFGF